MLRKSAAHMSTSSTKTTATVTEGPEQASSSSSSSPYGDLIRLGIFVPKATTMTETASYKRNTQHHIHRRLQQQEEQHLRELQLEELQACNDVGVECLDMLGLEPDDLFVGIQPGFCACITFDCVDRMNTDIQCGLEDEGSSTRSVPDPESQPDVAVEADVPEPVVPKADVILSDILV
jgi:hypothetical protein